MRILPSLAATAAFPLLCVLTGCTAQHQAGPMQRSVMFRVKQADFWLRAPRVADAIKADSGAVEAGQGIYANACSNCHGADGKGTPLGLNMYPQATDLTSQFAQGYSDRELYYLLWNGIAHTGMPKWDAQLQPDQVWQLIHFLRTMPTTFGTGAAKPSPESAESAEARGKVLADGRHLFKTQGCLECHSITGQPADSPDLTYEGDRGRSQEWLIGHLIDPGAYSPGSEMPSYGKLSGDQLNTLAVFLNALKRSNAMPNQNSGN